MSDARAAAQGIGAGDRSTTMNAAYPPPEKEITEHRAWIELPVLSDTGNRIRPTCTFDTCPADLDILFVSGGFGKGYQATSDWAKREAPHPARSRLTHGSWWIETGSQEAA